MVKKSKFVGYLYGKNKIMCTEIESSVKVCGGGGGGDGLNPFEFAWEIWACFDLFMATTNICCSIELEPKTLSQGQLNYAREMAADVVQNVEPKEATILFIKGLEPVEEIEKHEQILQKVEPLAVANDQKAQVIESPCQCSLRRNVIESPDQVNLKEPLSAPF